VRSSIFVNLLVAHSQCCYFALTVSSNIPRCIYEEIVSHSKLYALLLMLHELSLYSECILPVLVEDLLIRFTCTAHLYMFTYLS